MYNGRVCAAMKRVFVQRSVATPFIRKIVEKVEALRVRPHTDHAVDVEINEAVVNYVIAALSVGGIKLSGINRYHGKAGVRLYPNIKSMVIGDDKQDTEVYWCSRGEGSLKAVRESLR
jgi:acyl-CoA reductase-like NAD-dependent aldehyde dehydrogenase